MRTSRVMLIGRKAYFLTLGYIEEGEKDYDKAIEKGIKVAVRSAIENGIRVTNAQMSKMYEVNKRMVVKCVSAK